MAAYVPVAELLASKNVHVIIVSTSSPKYSKVFAENLGFELPGGIVIDSKRRTHRAARLKASVYASLVMPFKRHLKTFGIRALKEALRVSLVNATPGHGSSWQQGATLVLKHPSLEPASSSSSSSSSSSGITCSYAWREDYPGDWQPVKTVMQDALGILDAPDVSFPERLEFVIQCRNARKHSTRAANPSSTSTTTSSSTKKRTMSSAADDDCGDACSIDQVRKRSEQAMANK